jgi:hypothetical protein
MFADLGRYLTGTMLVAGGFLKHLLPDYNSTELFTVSDPGVYTLLCIVEVALGLALLLRAFGGREVYVGLVAFVVFTGIQAYYAFTGKHSCGCLGSLSVDSRWMLALDAALVAFLLVYLFMHAAKGRVKFLCLGLIVAALAGYASVELYAFGGKDTLRAVLSGTEYYASPAQVRFPTILRDERKTGTVSVQNRSDRPIKVVGISELPILMLGDGVPVTVPPGETGSFEVILTSRGEEGRNVKSFLIYCVDENRLTTIPAYLSWVVSSG